MNVICMEEDAFYALIERVVERLEGKREIQPKREKWIDQPAAMDILRISSKTTMQKLRDEGRLRYTQPHKKVILYDRDSIDTYLEAKAQDTF
ncbi:MAG: helix-turn-helix domain-containing protein [Cyclobacteriaceae bacterium]